MSRSKFTSLFRRFRGETVRLPELEHDHSRSAAADRRISVPFYSLIIGSNNVRDTVINDGGLFIVNSPVAVSFREEHCQGTRTCVQPVVHRNPHASRVTILEVVIAPAQLP